MFVWFIERCLKLYKSIAFEDGKTSSAGKLHALTYRNLEPNLIGFSNGLSVPKM